jgi:hypothetical protein
MDPNNITRFSKPRRFLDFGLSLSFASNDAKDRFIKLVQDLPEDAELPLGFPQICLQPGAKPFPEESTLPVIQTKLEDMEMGDIHELGGVDTVNLNIKTCDQLYVLDFIEQEPRPLSELTDEERAQVPQD